MRRIIIATGLFVATMAGPLVSQAADSSSEVKRLQEEIRQLKEANTALNQELRKANAQLLNVQSPQQPTASPTLATQSAITQPQKTSGIYAEPTMAPVAAEEASDRTIWSGFTNFFNPNWKQDISVTAGVKLWMNEWRLDRFYLIDANDINIPHNINIRGSSILSRPAAVTSNLEATPIPQLGVRYKWLVFTGSYYSETDFSFPTTTRISGTQITYPNQPLRQANFRRVVEDQTRATRTEWDVSAGIYVHPNIVILGGYKSLAQRFTYGVKDVNYSAQGSYASPPNASNGDEKIDVYGPTIGIAGSMPMAYGLGLYLSYAHGFMDLRQDKTANVSYDVGELGFSYTPGLDFLPPHMPLSAATVYGGYRYQAFETDYPKSTAAGRSDTTRGFVAGLNLSF